jgi:hypothetical protein
VIGLKGKDGKHWVPKGRAKSVIKETRELGKSLGAERPGHKYLTRSPLAGGGFKYVYTDVPGEEAELPEWIRTGSRALFGTTHTTKVFSSKRALINALQPYFELGKWRVGKDQYWSDRAGKMLDGYFAVIQGGPTVPVAEKMGLVAPASSEAS